jgi:hydrogenase nickel incorporation protein HypA/HybF
MSRRREPDLIRSILDQAVARAREIGAARIERVHVAIGEIAELDPALIQSLWNNVSRGTAAEQAQLQFRPIEAELQCMSCFERYHPTGGAIHCPHCGSFGAKILAGEEFYLESIE